jgi:hypothetical protein
MKKKVGLFVVAAILVGVAAGFVIRHWEAVTQRLAGRAMETERRDWVHRTQELESTIARLQHERQPTPAASTERLERAFGASSPLARGVSPAKLQCQELEAALHAFCISLDASETWRSHEVGKESWSFFADVFTAMEQHLPATGGIAYQPPLIVENCFYVYRLLGKKRVDVIRDVLKYEGDLAEPLMGALYRWLMSGRRCETPGQQPEQFKAVYHYACFFLNTPGGQSYLARRDSRIRLLIRYYAALIIHEANVRKMNEADIDLRFFLPLVATEVQSRNDLLHAEEYLRTLSELQAHYLQR